MTDIGLFTEFRWKLLACYGYLRVQSIVLIISGEYTKHSSSFWKFFTMKAGVNGGSNLIYQSLSCKKKNIF